MHVFQVTFNFQNYKRRQNIKIYNSKKQNTNKQTNKQTKTNKQTNKQKTII